MQLKHIISKDIKIATFEDSILSLVTVMKTNMISSVIIVDDNKQLIDIITEKRYCYNG